MRITFFVGVLISLIPLITVGTFNGLSLLGVLIVGVATYRVIKRDGLA